MCACHRTAPIATLLACNGLYSATAAEQRGRNRPKLLPFKTCHGTSGATPTMSCMPARSIYLPWPQRLKTVWPYVRFGVRAAQTKTLPSAPKPMTPALGTTQRRSPLAHEAATARRNTITSARAVIFPFRMIMTATEKRTPPSSDHQTGHGISGTVQRHRLIPPNSDKAAINRQQPTTTVTAKPILLSGAAAEHRPFMFIEVPMPQCNTKPTDSREMFRQLPITTATEKRITRSDAATVGMS